MDARRIGGAVGFGAGDTMVAITADRAGPRLMNLARASHTGMVPWTSAVCPRCVAPRRARKAR